MGSTFSTPPRGDDYLERHRLERRRAELRQVILEVEDEVAEAIGNERGAPKLPALKHVWVVAKDDRGSRVESGLRQEPLRVRRLISVFVAGVERDHHHVGLLGGPPYVLAYRVHVFPGYAGDV